MRLWSIHPEYLDAKGLVALWRESLLAQKVLLGQTSGYRNHPQLIRFRLSPDPLAVISNYLTGILEEADKRGYNFDSNKIINETSAIELLVTSGQIEYEFNHLLNKLKQRAPSLYLKLKNIEEIKPHYLFIQKEGKIESWEVIKYGTI